MIWVWKWLIKDYQLFSVAPVMQMEKLIARHSYQHIHNCYTRCVLFYTSESWFSIAPAINNNQHWDLHTKHEVRFLREFMITSKGIFALYIIILHYSFNDVRVQDTIRLHFWVCIPGIVVDGKEKTFSFAQGRKRSKVQRDVEFEYWISTG